MNEEEVDPVLDLMDARIDQIEDENRNLGWRIDNAQRELESMHARKANNLIHLEKLHEARAVISSTLDLRK